MIALNPYTKPTGQFNIPYSAALLLDWVTHWVFYSFGSFLMATNENGQFVIEGILLMIVFLAIILAFIAFINKNNLLSDLVQKPWQGLSGMLENGEWQPPAQGQALHPSQHGRHVTIEGSKP